MLIVARCNKADNVEDVRVGRMPRFKSPAPALGPFGLLERINYFLEERLLKPQNDFEDLRQLPISVHRSPFSLGVTVC